VSPNPVKPGDTGSIYVIDIGLINTGDYATITAREAVRRIEAIAGASLLEESGYDVRQFIALDSVSDVLDNGADERQELQDQTEIQKHSENPFTKAGEMLTLVVVLVVALAVIQISKDL
jgi:hypothetical protein